MAILASPSSRSFLFIWLVLLGILFLNLLIAAFNDTWTDMKGQWEHEGAISMFKLTHLHMRTYPVPPPLNLLFLPYDLLRVFIWRCCRKGGLPIRMQANETAANGLRCALLSPCHPANIQNALHGLGRRRRAAHSYKRCYDVHEEGDTTGARP